MNVLVDTSVWSLALRRDGKSDDVDELRALIEAGRVEIIGPIRQELLSGIRNDFQFNLILKELAAFPDLTIETIDYVTAARFFNLCRSNGVQGSNTDFLICAVASRRKLAVYTTDKDFTLYAKHLPFVLHKLV